MKLKIEKIRLDKLMQFVNGDVYRTFQTVPITPYRALSYSNNPKGIPGDIVLYMGMLNGQLVAFRTILADSLSSSRQITRFGWCSGNWVHPDFRRKGFSEMLLKEAYKDWNGRLMFTNYAPHSELLYLKTGWFHPIHQFDGIRAYLFPKLMKLNPGFKKGKFLQITAHVVDSFVVFISTIRLALYSAKQNETFVFVENGLPDDECYEFNEKRPVPTFFERSNPELKWIFSYPWISKNDDSFVLRYPFSSFSKSFSYHTIKIFKEKQLIGFFIFSVRKGVLKTLYFNVPEELCKEVAKFIKRFCKQNKIEIVTIYNSRIANELYQRKNPFLYVKRYGQKIYSSFDSANNTLHFQDGDGDVIFT